MNGLILFPLAILAWRDYANKGEVEDYIAIPSLLGCLFFIDMANLVLLPILAVGLYIMHKSGCLELDLIAFGFVFMAIGLWAFVALLAAIELVWIRKEKMPARKGIAFLPYLFFGVLASVAGSALL